MAKKPSSKREKAEKAEKEDAGYEFPSVQFDEKAFMRREVESARMTFWTLAIAIPAGILAWVLGRAADWWLGWIPIILGLLIVGPIMKRMGYSEENTAPKAMFGNWFLLFFTALGIWVVAVNV